MHAFPIHYISELTGGGLPPFALACFLALVGVLPWSAVLALMLLWYAAEVPLAYALGTPPSLRTPLFWVLRDVLLPVLWLGGWVIRDYTWRGRPIDAHSPG